MYTLHEIYLISFVYPGKAFKGAYSWDREKDNYEGNYYYLPHFPISSWTLNSIFLNVREMHFWEGRHLTHCQYNTYINNVKPPKIARSLQTSKIKFLRSSRKMTAPNCRVLMIKTLLTVWNFLWIISVSVYSSVCWAQEGTSTLT